MNAIEISVLLLPPAIYLLAMAWFHAGTRTRVVHGPLDKTLLGFALAGPLLIGPLKFLPLGDALVFWEMLGNEFGFGNYSGVVIVLGMILFLLLVAISRFAARTREKIVLYNIDNGELGDVFGELAPKLDPNYRWAGNSLFLPTLQVQFTVERTPLFRVISLVATTRLQDPVAWDRVESELRAAVKERRVGPNRARWILASMGMAMFLLLVCLLMQRS